GPACSDRGLWLSASWPPLQQSSQGTEVQVQVTVVEAEVALQLLHALGEQHQRLPQALDLFVAQIAGLDSAQRLTLHQLAQELDDREYELRQPPLDALRIGVHPPRQGVAQLRLRGHGTGRRDQSLVAHPSSPTNE